MKTLRVIIFEDNRSLREGLFQLINGSSGFECAGAFANCTDIVNDIRQTNPDERISLVEAFRISVGVIHESPQLFLLAIQSGIA